MNDPLESPRPQISLFAIARFLWRHVWLIGACTVLLAVAATALAYLRTQYYRSEVVFSPTNGSGGLGDIGGGSLGGLAALAGVNIGGGGKRSEEFLEYLRSQTFTRGFIERHQLLPVLFARKWNAQEGKWKTDDPPTLADAERRFSKKIRQITEDRRTGIVRLAIVWSNRQVAAQWANQFIAEADDALRQRAIVEYNRSLDYLTSETSKTSVVELRAAIYKAMESELKDAMLARTRDAYAFKVLDPAVVPDAKDIDSPSKALYLVLGAVFGLLLGIAIAASRERRVRQVKP
jgi:LPS O-antigen subunit length determinant protein (WzzB/FepE family)